MVQIVVCQRAVARDGDIARSASAGLRAVERDLAQRTAACRARGGQRLGRRLVLLANRRKIQIDECGHVPKRLVLGANRHGLPDRGIRHADRGLPRGDLRGPLQLGHFLEQRRDAGDIAPLAGHVHRLLDRLQGVGCRDDLAISRLFFVCSLGPSQFCLHIVDDGGREPIGIVQLQLAVSGEHQLELIGRQGRRVVGVLPRPIIAARRMSAVAERIEESVLPRRIVPFGDQPAGLEGGAPILTDELQIIPVPKSPRIARSLSFRRSIRTDKHLLRIRGRGETQQPSQRGHPGLPIIPRRPTAELLRIGVVEARLEAGERPQQAHLIDPPQQRGIEFRSWSAHRGVTRVRRIGHGGRHGAGRGWFFLLFELECGPFHVVGKFEGQDRLKPARGLGPAIERGQACGLAID